MVATGRTLVQLNRSRHLGLARRSVAAMDRTNTAAGELTIRNLGVGTEQHNYEEIWQLQRDLHEAVVAGTSSDIALLLEHQSIFTAGRRTATSDLPTNSSLVLEVDRGGKITWHGPGQVVCYVIAQLPNPLDVIAHVRRLETVTTLVCSDFGITTHTVEGRSGVWVSPDQFRDPTSTQFGVINLGSPSKIGAVGVRVAQGVTMHGLSLNANCDLGWSRQIVPCGISDAGVTSMSQVLDRDISPAALVASFERALRSVWATTATPQATTKVGV